MYQTTLKDNIIPESMAVAMMGQYDQGNPNTIGQAWYPNSPVFQNGLAGRLSGVGCADCTMGELTSDQATIIFTNHFKNLPTSTIIGIGTDLLSGKFDTLAAEGKKVTEEICGAGANEKFTDFFTNNWYWVFPAAAAVGIGIFFALKK